MATAVHPHFKLGVMGYMNEGLKDAISRRVTRKLCKKRPQVKRFTLTACSMGWRTTPSQICGATVNRRLHPVISKEVWRICTRDEIRSG